MNRNTLANLLFNLLPIIIVAVWILAIGSFAFSGLHLTRLGREMGQWAIRVLWIIAIPGIFKRFGVKGLLQDVQIILMKSRRRLGILMFSLAFTHFLWVRMFKYIRFGLPRLSIIPQYEMLGLIAFLLIIPLFITSNNYSLKSLKKNWQRIHYLVYPAIWLIAFHVSLLGRTGEAYITFFIGLLQIGSWTYYWHRRKIATE